MSRTWLARGVSAGVIAFVVGAWAVGLALGTDEPPEDRQSVPSSPDSSLAPSEEPSVMGEREDRRPRPSDDPTDVVPVAETTDATDEPATDEPADDGPRTPKPSTRPSPRPSTTPRPSPTDRPTTPSPTPSDPDCNELTEVLDCVLAPITTRP